MKKISLVVVTFLLLSQLLSDDLILIDVNNLTKVKTYLNNDAIKVNFINEDFLIATVLDFSSLECKFLKSDCWKEGENYFLLWLGKDSAEYILQINHVADILLQRDQFLIVSTEDKNCHKIVPNIHNGVVKINNIEAKLPQSPLIGLDLRLDEDPFVVELLELIDEAQLDFVVQELEDFVTREWFTPTSVGAQNWIVDRFNNCGLHADIQEIPYTGGEVSDNVYAIIEGSLFPDEFVVLGSHYDSYSVTPEAPGADDNATGCSLVLEIARILSQYNFKRSIIFCTFSGEEYGLFGSEEFAETADNNDMDIIGYFNTDLAGFLYPGHTIHTDLIAPESADALAQFYMDVCSIYLPDFPIHQGEASGYDSDHTSFNNHGFMGIWPIEDDTYLTPFIHTSQDINGLSVNDYELFKTLTKATLASVVTLANLFFPPQNLFAVTGDEIVELYWEESLEASAYNIYKDDDEDPIATVTGLTFVDVNVMNNQEYTYFVRAIHSTSGEESIPSNLISVTPQPPLELPFFDDFENGAIHWNVQNPWGVTIYNSFSEYYSLSESPVGNYQSNQDLTACLSHIDLTNCLDAEFSFWAIYNVELNHDRMDLEISTDAFSWDIIDSFTGINNDWTQYTYSLNDYLDYEAVRIRFHFYSDFYNTRDGMYIDDVEINVENITSAKNPIAQTNPISNFPNPFNPSTTITFNITENVSEFPKIEIYNLIGQKIKILTCNSLSAGQHSVTWDGSDQSGQSVSSGVYFYRLKIGKFEQTKKMLLMK